MKIDAHPLVVAVALGLLGPGVLLEEEEEHEGTCARCGEDPEPEAWEPGPAPDAEEFHRVEIEWLKLENRKG